MFPIKEFLQKSSSEEKDINEEIKKGINENE